MNKLIKCKSLYTLRGKKGFKMHCEGNEQMFCLLLFSMTISTSPNGNSGRRRASRRENESFHALFIINGLNENLQFHRRSNDCCCTEFIIRFFFLSFLASFFFLCDFWNTIKCFFLFSSIFILFSSINIFFSFLL